MQDGRQLGAARASVFPASTLIAARYRVERELGRGAAGAVLEVVDTTAQRKLALKRLCVSADKARAEEQRALFEREYYILSELSHPAIVAVYDFGCDDRGAYYTMELLDGADLAECGRLPYRSACGLLHDVCSALALVHARRFVHRDLSARNVRSTSDGHAKLFDFGALAPMGHSAGIAGTPAFMAPELLHRQALDGRSDLFSIGALAYYVLCGRHAYAAQHVRDLPDVWRSRPAPPSAFAPEVPQALDALVMSLLSLYARARPRSASEAAERFAALGQLAAEPPPRRSKLHFLAPAFVGRSAEQARFRKHLKRAQQGDGGALLVEAEAGAGRTRMLAAYALEAKLAGAIVLSVAGGDQARVELSLARALLAQLDEIAPDALRAATACRPEAERALLARLLQGGAAPATAEVLGLLVESLLDTARLHPLCLLADDLHEADRGSSALIAELCARAYQAPLLVVCSVARGQACLPPRLLETISRAATRVGLPRLAAADTLDLVRSLFGDAADVEACADLIQRRSGGLPRAVVQLAEHLIERGVAGGVGDRCDLSGLLDAERLPDSIEQLLQARLSALSAPARMLAQLLSLVTAHAPLGLPDLLALLACEVESRDAFCALDELVRAQVLKPSGEHYAVADGALLCAAERALCEARRSALHRRLGERYERWGGRARLVAAYHFLHAGDEAAAIACLPEPDAGIDIASPSASLARSAAGISLLERLYARACARGAAPHQLHAFQKLMLQLAATHEPSLALHAQPLLARLLRDSGFLDYAQPPSGPPTERLARCLQRAQARYLATPEAERFLSPLDSVRELVVTTGILCGVHGRTMDCTALAALPQRIEPFVGLAEVVSVLHELVELATASTVRARDVQPRRHALIERLAQPLAGLDDVTREGARCVLLHLAALDAVLACDPRALVLADALCARPRHAPLGFTLRMLHAIAHGDVEGAERARVQRDLLASLQLDSDAYLVRSVVTELQLAVRGADLFAVKRLLPAFEQEAARFAGWQPWRQYALSAYDALRGRPRPALGRITACLDGLPEVGHSVWLDGVALQAELLVRGGDAGHALRVIDRAIETLRARGTQLCELRDGLPLQLACALAEGAVGLHDQARDRVEVLLAEHERLGRAGIPRYLLLELRARLSLLAGERTEFPRLVRLASEALEPHRPPALNARLDQLLADARGEQRGLAHAQPKEHVGRR